MTRGPRRDPGVDERSGTPAGAGEDALVDQASRDSFPASDPPAFWRGPPDPAPLVEPADGDHGQAR